MNKDDKLKN